MPEFCHLHCHTQFSLLDGACDIGDMMDKVIADGQKAIAMTDHGNMFGAFKFAASAKKKGIKGIIGCEFYMVENRHIRAFTKESKDKRFHQLLLAKNQKGYENLSKLCSIGFMEGMYSKFPRIDKTVVEKYHEGLIATSCCLGSEIQQLILQNKLIEAENTIKWWLDLFGEDFYIEIQRQKGLENIDGTGISQEDINQKLIGFARKYQIKLIATNDAHYIDEQDNLPHDILLCINTGMRQSVVDRFKFPSSDFYVKNMKEMEVIFSDIPQALDNTVEIADKIETPHLERDILLPNFPLPLEFTSQYDFLTDLVYKGAKRLYKEIGESLRERIDHELHIIHNMGFEGYFLIVQDFIAAARDMGVMVGPGRGSAAGSVVAYCLQITNIDPIKYNLLFERFLNPERISMPDIDIDFDDDGRQRVIDWVVNKYGKDKVAQIITFGTMAAKSSIRDVSRVLDLQLKDADRLAKMVPTKPNTKLNKILRTEPNQLTNDWNGEDLNMVRSLNEIYREGEDEEREVLENALKLEGSVRNTGIHAAGIIIAPDELTKYIPVCTSSESELLVTQFDGSIIESAGMLKMDFLGLKTLSIIKDAINNIVKRRGKEAYIDPNEIPLDDEKALELYQNGDMIGIFQFESEGMRKYLRELKPSTIEDIIAMNALYRPGPMDYIPSFIRRKHGLEPIEYPHEWLEEILKPTYGIMVYQEQIMQTAQIMADYSLGQADLLRRAMGKKKASEMEKHSQIFVEGATKKGVPHEQAEKIFEVMAKFAEYGFNRSHSAAYSVVSFHTAYLKAHYPAEFMAAVLTSNKNDISKLNFFLIETRRMGIEVLLPDINESDLNFSVNKDGNIRFGLSGLKGIGEGPVLELLKEKNKKGNFKDIWDICTRCDSKAINKKVLESLVWGGAFDSWTGYHRAQYFAPSDKYQSAIEHALKFGSLMQTTVSRNINSLFDMETTQTIEPPKLPNTPHWDMIYKLNKELEVAGIYLSGHPLDDYIVEMQSLVNCSIDKLDQLHNTPIRIAGIITDMTHAKNAKGLGYGKFTIMDYTDKYSGMLFQENYLKYSSLFKIGAVLCIEGINRERYGSPGNWSFYISNVKLLETVGQEELKQILIELPISRITDHLIESLHDLISKNEGKHKCKILVKEDVQNFELKLNVGINKVQIDKSFIHRLEILGLRYRLN